MYICLTISIDNAFANPFILFMKRVLLLVVLLAMCFHSFAAGPLQRGRVTFGPKVEFTDNLYGAVANYGTGLLSAGVTALTGSPWVSKLLIPSSAGTRLLVNRDIVTPAGAAQVRWWDWKLRNHVFGYEFEFQPTVSHLGYGFELDYERQSRMAKLPGADDFMEFSKMMVTPGVTLQYQFSDLIEHSWTVNLVVGAKYNYAFKCSGLSDEVKSVNNGFTGTIGLGVSFLPSNVDIDTGYEFSYYQIRVMYSRDMFIYFNPEYVNAAGVKPYEGWTSKYGYLTFQVTAFM